MHRRLHAARNRQEIAAQRIDIVNDDAGVIERSATSLVDGKALGWHQGRMEFGPRALGGRSILGDPRSPAMQKLLNLKVKHRESFRPFAPSVLREDVAQWDARYNLERAQRLLPDPDEADPSAAQAPHNAERAATTMRGYSPGLP